MVRAQEEELNDRKPFRKLGGFFILGESNISPTFLLLLLMERNNDLLEFFDKVAFQGGIDYVHSIYSSSRTMQEDGFSLYENIDKPGWFSFGVNEFSTPILVNRDDFPEYILERELVLMIERIHEKYKSTSQSDYVDWFNKIADRVLSILKSLERHRRVDDFKSLVYDKLFEYTGILEQRYSGLLNHKLFAYRRSVNSFAIGVFHLKDLSITFLKDLYVITADLGIIDDLEISEDSFIAVLKDPNPTNQIKFSCRNGIVVHYIDEISLFFNRLERRYIESSGLFLNSEGTPLTRAALDAASSRNRNKYLDIKDQISEAISTLKDQYL